MASYCGHGKLLGSCIDIVCERSWLRAQLEAVTLERDEWKHNAETSRDNALRFLGERDAALERERRLREALEQAEQPHSLECWNRMTPYKPECICGLWEAIKKGDETKNRRDSDGH